MSNEESWLEGVTPSGELEVYKENSNQQMFNKGLGSGSKCLPLSLLRRYGFKNLIPEAILLLRIRGFTVNETTMEVSK